MILVVSRDFACSAARFGFAHPIEGKQQPKTPIPEVSIPDDADGNPLQRTSLPMQGGDGKGAGNGGRLLAPDLIFGSVFEVYKSGLEMLVHDAIHIHENAHDFHDVETGTLHGPRNLRRRAWLQDEFVHVVRGKRPRKNHLDHDVGWWAISADPYRCQFFRS